MINLKLTSARLVFTCVLLLAFDVFAMELEIHGGNISLKGDFQKGDFDRFKTSLEKSVGTRRIIFNNCLGGLVDEGVKIAETIRIKELSTVAKNQVQSACAYAFLAGKTREFDQTRGLHLILFHASRNVDSKNDVASRINNFLIPYMEALTEGKMSPYISSLIRKSVGAKQGVVFVRENLLFSKAEKAFYCDGSETDGLKQCQVLTDVNAEQMGVVKIN